DWSSDVCSSDLLIDNGADSFTHLSPLSDESTANGVTKTIHLLEKVPDTLTDVSDPAEVTLLVKTLGEGLEESSDTLDGAGLHHVEELDDRLKGAVNDVQERFQVVEEPCHLLQVDGCNVCTDTRQLCLGVSDSIMDGLAGLGSVLA